MSNNKGLVSIIIPGKNSALKLEDCLISIRKQSYKKIEVVIVDSFSKDNTKVLARKYRCRLINYVPKVPEGTFDAPHKRNYGAKKAQGEYFYYVDADMVLTKNVVKEGVEALSRSDAVIVREDSIGEGIWARAKNLERRCYFGDDTVEAPRFVSAKVWKKLGGLDENLGGGGDDWDFYRKLVDNRYRVVRIKSLVFHNEGKLRLRDLIKKRFMYGRDSLSYISKRPHAGIVSYFPLRLSYLKNWKLFLARPLDSLAFIIMRTCEYSAGFAGIFYSFLHKRKTIRLFLIPIM